MINFTCAAKAVAGELESVISSVSPASFAPKQQNARKGHPDTRPPRCALSQSGENQEIDRGILQKVDAIGEQRYALRRVVRVVALLNLSYFGVEFAVAPSIGCVYDGPMDATHTTKTRFRSGGR